MIISKLTISLIISILSGLGVAVGLWSQAKGSLGGKRAVYWIILKYLGILVFFGVLLYFPPGLILDAILFVFTISGSLLLAAVRRKSSLKKTSNGHTS